VDQLIELCWRGAGSPSRSGSRVVDPLPVTVMCLRSIHRSLLQVRRETDSGTGRTATGPGLRHRRSRCTERQQTHDHRQVLGERRLLRKVLIIAWKPATSPGMFPTDRQHRGQPDGRVHRIRPPTQSPKPNMFIGSIPNAITASALVDTATKCLATAVLSQASRATRSRRLGVRYRLSVVKVLDETMTVSRRVEVASCLCEVRPVDVRHERSVRSRRCNEAAPRTP